MSYGLEIVNLFAVLGVTCLLIALAVIWYAPAFFGKWIPQPSEGEASSNAQAYLQVALSGAALFVALFIVAYIVSITPLLSLQTYHVAVGLFLVIAGIRGSEAVRLQHSLKHFLADCGYYALVIIGGALLFTYWPT